MCGAGECGVAWATRSREGRDKGGDTVRRVGGEVCFHMPRGRDSKVEAQGVLRSAKQRECSDKQRTEGSRATPTTQRRKADWRTHIHAQDPRACWRAGRCKVRAHASLKAGVGCAGQGCTLAQQLGPASAARDLSVASQEKGGRRKDVVTLCQRGKGCMTTSKGHVRARAGVTAGAAR